MITPPPVARYHVPHGCFYQEKPTAHGSTEVVYASSYDLLAAECERLRKALRQIRDWEGGCVDHPRGIGLPNPKEIAAKALTPTSQETP